MSKPRIAILISGTGTNMVALVNACKAGELQADITFVGSDRASAKGLITAQEMGMETKLFNYKLEGKENAEARLADEIEATNSEWIVLAGYMRILTPDFVRRFQGKIINIHPALLPSFPGAHAIQDAWDAGVETTGVTIHIVDEEVDHGPILAQEEVHSLPEDTIETLEERIHKTEHKLYKAALKKFFENLK